MHEISGRTLCKCDQRNRGWSRTGNYDNYKLIVFYDRQYPSIYRTVNIYDFLHSLIKSSFAIADYSISLNFPKGKK